MTKTQAARALHEAIDAATAAGRTTPCRLNGSYDAEDLDALKAADLVHWCRTACPVLAQCTDLAVLIPTEFKQGTVIAGTYYPPSKIRRWQPLYDDLRDRIETGEYSPGDHLPSMHELADSTGLHGNVIRTALDHLERDGFVVPDGRDATLVVSYGSLVGSRQFAITAEPQQLPAPADDSAVVTDRQVA